MKSAKLANRPLKERAKPLSCANDLDNAHRKLVKRTWGNIPVVDATKELRVFILPEDVSKAKPKNFGECVFAQACIRTFHSSKVLFFRTCAYVDLPDAKGNIRVERFWLSGEMRQLIADFDKGKGVVPKGGFLLKTPPPTEMLDAKAKASRDFNRSKGPKYKKKRKAEIVGRTTVSTNSARIFDGVVRHGSGMVQFRGGATPPAAKAPEGDPS